MTAHFSWRTGYASQPRLSLQPAGTSGGKKPARCGASGGKMTLRQSRGSREVPSGMHSFENRLAHLLQRNASRPINDFHSSLELCRRFSITVNPRESVKNIFCFFVPSAKKILAPLLLL